MANTRKNENIEKIYKKNIEKQQGHTQIHWIRNVIYMFGGIVILAIGIMIPKTIFAMMDKHEINKIYIRETDASYLDAVSTMTMQEKLDLLDWRNMGTHVSNSYPDDNAYEITGNEKLQAQVITQVKQMQGLHLLPQFDFYIDSMEKDAVGFNYESLVNLENMNQYLMLAYMTYQVSTDYVYIEVDVETGKILGYTVYAEITQKEWQELLNADIAQYMADNLGVSKSVIVDKYQYGVYDEKRGTVWTLNANGNLVQDYYDSAYEDDQDLNMMDVQIGMWMKEADETQTVGTDDMDMIEGTY